MIIGILRFMKKLLIILTFLFSLSALEAEEPFFEYIGGPDGGTTTKLEISKSNTLYLGTYNGLFKSTNSGRNWVQIFNYGQVKHFSIFNDSIFLFLQVTCQMVNYSFQQMEVFPG